jgi:hypothetical protein
MHVSATAEKVLLTTSTIRTDSTFQAKVLCRQVMRAFTQNIKSRRIVQVVSGTFAACSCCYPLPTHSTLPTY